MAGDWKRLAVSWSAPLDGHHIDALHNKRGRGFTVPCRPRAGAWAVKRRGTHDPAMEPSRVPKIGSAEFGSQGDVGPSPRRAGRTIVRVLSNERSLPGEHPPPKEHHNESPGTPVPDSAAELPPIIRRQEVVAIA